MGGGCNKSRSGNNCLIVLVNAHSNEHAILLIIHIILIILVILTNIITNILTIAILVIMTLTIMMLVTTATSGGLPRRF